MPAWQFYIGYQPWINLIYLVILLSPVFVERWLSRKRLPAMARA